MNQFILPSRTFSLLFLALCFVMCSCDDDDDDDDDEVRHDNFFQLGETRLPISGGFLISWQDPVRKDAYATTVYQNEIVFYNKGIEVGQDADGNISVEGSGDILSFFLMTPYSRLEEGTYSLNSNVHAPSIFTFQRSGITVVNALGTTECVEFTEGQVTVSIRGGVYKVHVTGVVSNDFNGDGNDIGYITTVEFEGALIAEDRD